jgi:membrane protein DedA with SNARE-associated domain
MTLSMLIARYGLLAVFAGALLEGETLLAVAGYAAHRGYLDFGAVAAVGALGAVLGDQFWFWLGRRKGRELLAQRPSWAARIGRALVLIERHPNAILAGQRFVWGLRTALPLAAGMSRVSARRFVALNAFSALLWAPLVAGTGYLSGALASHAVEALHRYEHWGVAAVLAVSALWHVVRLLRRRHAKP